MFSADENIFAWTLTRVILPMQVQWSSSDPMVFFGDRPGISWPPIPLSTHVSWVLIISDMRLQCAATNIYSQQMQGQVKDFRIFFHMSIVTVRCVIASR